MFKYVLVKNIKYNFHFVIKYKNDNEGYYSSVNKKLEKIENINDIKFAFYNLKYKELFDLFDDFIVKINEYGTLEELFEKFHSNKIFQ